MTVIRKMFAVLVLASLAGSALAAAKRPNILFILSDDQRWDALGAYGNKSIRTPNLDKLASQGTRLDGFYVSSPQCCPSRAGLLSGKFAHQNGVQDNANHPDLKPNETTVATLLNAAGYQTGFVGKAHMGGDPRKWGFKETPMWLPWAESPHDNPEVMVDGKSQKLTGEITQIFADTAIRYLEKNKDKTWFLWFATTAPHKPLVDDPRYPYKESELKPPPGWPAGDKFAPGKQWTMYYSTISLLDAEIGRVLKKLDDLGLSDNTLVIFASDNGYELGSHGFEGKMVWYEESTRVPAIVRWPGKVKPGSNTGALMSGVDLLPTILEAAGAPAKKFSGASMIPVLTGGKSTRTVVFSEGKSQTKLGANSFWQMAKSADWKYVRFNDGKEIFYDLKKDPWEKTDASGDPASQPGLTAARKALEEWNRQTS